MSTKYKIGYIDEDEHQVKLYTRKLEKYDFKVISYEIRKGMSLDDLMEQVYQSDIDLLMIDFKLNETNKVSFNGEEVEKNIYDVKPLFPHIIFTNKVDQAEPFVEDWKIIYDKDVIFDDDDDEKVIHFVNMLRKSIEQYRNHITNKKKILADLLEKGEEKGLSSVEKNDLLIIQEELNNLDKTQRNEVPKQLISDDKIEALSKTKKEAEKFLQTLIEKSDKK